MPEPRSSTVWVMTSTGTAWLLTPEAEHDHGPPTSQDKHAGSARLTSETSNHSLGRMIFGGGSPTASLTGAHRVCAVQLRQPSHRYHVESTQRPQR